MKSLSFFKLLGTLAVVLGLFTIPLRLDAQQDTQSPQSPSTQSPADNPPQAQTFAGKIVKAKGNLVLKDESSNTTYKLDNADQAKQYLGKNVKVTGTLDPATHMIHISNIEVASGPSSY
jgi:hypothetical protein